MAISVEQESSTSRSFFGSIRKIGRKNSNLSTKSTSSTRSNHSVEHQQTTTTNTAIRGPTDLKPTRSPMSRRSHSPNPMGNPSAPTRRPDRPGMNAFTVPSNEPPPAYTPSPTASSGPTYTPLTSNSEPPLPAALPQSTAPITQADGSEDPYAFLSTFDTTLLIDDSGSMAGRGWREVSQALSTIAPIVTSHDSDGIAIYFLNHKSVDSGNPSEGVAPSGYRRIKRAETINEIFNRVHPQGGTPTGIRVHHILKPYLAHYEKCVQEGKECKPLNLIVLTDGVPSDDVESVLISAAKKLDKFDAPPFQVGVQFFQVGNEAGAKEALEELDDELSNMVEGGIRDMVDTVTWTGGRSAAEGGVGLTGDAVLKAVLGAVVKRLDRRRASGEQRRGARS